MENKVECHCKHKHTLDMLKEEFKFYLDQYKKNADGFMEYFMDRGPIVHLDLELSAKAKLCERMLGLINYLESEEIKNV